MYAFIRLGKEFKMYEKEARDLAEKVKKMESDGKDEYDIRKQVQYSTIYLNVLTRPRLTDKEFMKLPQIRI